MNPSQQLFIIVYGLLNGFSIFLAIYKIKTSPRASILSKHHGNNKFKDTGAYGLSPALYVFGSFVWGDALVLGFFWSAASYISYMQNDWYLFWLIFFLFWTIRSLGESIYWFNQQFSKVVRVPPHFFPFHWFFKDDSVWFVAQVIAQCVTIISIIGSIYFGVAWVQSF